MERRPHYLGCDFILRRAFRGTRGIPGIEEVPNDLLSYRFRNVLP